jgi:hypothetical protein
VLPLFFFHKLERLDQAILDVIDNPKMAQKNARVGTLICQTLGMII